MDEKGVALDEDSFVFRDMITKVLDEEEECVIFSRIISLRALSTLRSLNEDLVWVNWVP